MELIHKSLCTPVRKGSNPVFATKRSKIQSDRSKLNQQLSKQMRLRAGAENLYNATTNAKVRDTVALELSFLNSNLQLLKDELGVINGHLSPYQNESAQTQSIAMVSLGLKETQELDLCQPLKDFILEHYSEEPLDYEDQINDLIDLRNSIRTPARTKEGVNLLLEYYNQLYFIDYRFFPPNRQLGIHFHWYDSITGIPSMQKSISLEKASVLFNVAALYSQIGTRSNRCKRTGIESAIVAYEQSAGTFNYLRLNFSHAPCTDLSHAFLAVMTKLMLAQAQECVFEKRVLGGFEIELGECISVAQEAAKVSDKYTLVHTAMTVAPVNTTVPSSWIGIVNVKSLHYKALSHYYAAIALLQQLEVAETDKISSMLSSLHLETSNAEDIPTPENIVKRKDDRNRLGRAHLRQAITLHERAIQAFRLAKGLNKVDSLLEFLNLAHKRSLEKESAFKNEEDFFEIIDAPDIHPHSDVETELRPPDLTAVNVTDIFKKLGPLSVFSARQKFTAPRKVRATTRQDGWGFTFIGDSPVTIATTTPRGKEMGLKVGDVITKVAGKDVRWKSRVDVVNIMEREVSIQRKSHEEKAKKVISSANEKSLSFSIDIELVTVLATESPQTAGKISSSQVEPSGIGDDAFYSSTGTSETSLGKQDTKNKTFPVKRRYRSGGNKTIATTHKNRHSLGFFHGLKLKLRTNSFSTPTENPYASTSSLDTISNGSGRLLSSSYSPLSIPKATEKSSINITRSETFSAPNNPQPQVTMFTKKMDIGYY